MLNAFADLLPFVFGLVAAPLPVVAVILLLMAEGGRAKAVAFIAAWTATVFVVATAGRPVGPQPQEPGDDPRRGRRRRRLRTRCRGIGLGRARLRRPRQPRAPRPLAFVLLSGRAGARALESARAWLIAHNDTVTMTVLFVFGGVFLAKGLRALVR